MAKNKITLDTSGLEAALAKLAHLEKADAPKIVEEALSEIGAQINADTETAVSPANLPAGGKYSSGDTARAIVKDARVRWNAGVAEIPIGFDFDAPGAGGYLITGTPKMKPDMALHRMYKQKKYMEAKKQDLANLIWDQIFNTEGV